ncbi:MAG: hypothetical protein U0841_22140 [Chloroflexia bacterium]
MRTTDDHSPRVTPIAPTETEEVCPREQVRRGRRFLRLYLALLALATITLITLALLVRGQDALLRFDLPVERAIRASPCPATAGSSPASATSAIPPTPTSPTSSSSPPCSSPASGARRCSASAPPSWAGSSAASSAT